jgi:hypothetical protein
MHWLRITLHSRPLAYTRAKMFTCAKKLAALTASWAHLRLALVTLQIRRQQILDLPWQP